MTRPTVLTYANSESWTRTSNQGINSALLCHWATSECFAHCHKPTWAVGWIRPNTNPIRNSLVTLVTHWILQRRDLNPQHDAYETPALPLMLLCDLSEHLMSALQDNLNITYTRNKLCVRNWTLLSDTIGCDRTLTQTFAKIPPMSI